MQSHELPADFWYSKPLVDSLNRILAEKYGVQSLVRSISNYQVNFDLKKVGASNVDFSAVKQTAVDFLQKQPGILFAVDMASAGRPSVPEKIRNMMINGYNFKRSGQIQIVLNACWYEGYSKTGTTHGTWNPYDTHIPLLWYGWNIKHGSTNDEVYMTDISATIAALLHIQMPNGCIGKPIKEVLSR